MLTPAPASGPVGFGVGSGMIVAEAVLELVGTTVLEASRLQ